MSVTITANQPGVTRVNFISIDRLEVIITCEITVEAPPDGIIRILAIGNSFSVDAVEDYLYDIAKAAGKQVIIGNLSIAGGQLDQHVANAQNNLNPYNYTKIDVDGNKNTTFNNAIEPVLKSERWDYISLQQVSQNSGMYSTFVADLPVLYNYVKKNAINRNVRYILHQTWAYQQGSTHTWFANYNNDQQTMYKAIVETYNKAKDLINADMIIPAGTAIQNARTSFVGDNLTRDGYHLELSYGRYIAASTWFAKIFGESVIGNTYKPTSIPDYYREMAQHAAQAAITSPDEVTVLTDFQEPPVAQDGDGIIQITFSGTGVGWNTLTSAQRIDGVIPSLTDKNGNPTGVSLKVIERFNGGNSNGATNTSTILDMPSTVSGSSYFGNTKTIYEGLIVPKTVIRFSGLDKDKSYEFCFFASRTGVSDNREAKYTCKGDNEVSVLLDASNNSTNVACASSVRPNSVGEVELTITAGPANTNSVGFYYINAMRISSGE